MKKKIVCAIILLFVLITCVSTINATRNNISPLSLKKTEIYNDSEPSIHRVNITFQSSGYVLYGEIYYPSNDSRSYPGIVFCEGRQAYISVYTWISKALSKEGYVVLIFDLPGQGKSEGLFPICWNISFPYYDIYLRFNGLGFEPKFHYSNGEYLKAVTDALTFLIEESPVHQILNSTRIGLIGHSMGGFLVTEAAAQDKRVDAVVALSHGNPDIMVNVSVPVQFQLGTADIFTKSFSAILSCYGKASPPKELITISGGTHVGFTTVLQSFCPCPSWQKEICLRYVIGWFDYFLKNKTGSYETITTGTTHLSRLIPSRYNFGNGDCILENTAVRN
jgi:dienelactone hydrolase